ncbi:MauE/DoxX family redox-associated membrane protein [Muriicola sp. Z0-33]|uniref:DoxX family protein n=1 Tax=Muriicola sp. Z0-33 TaxID=2816957 RepID=UPI0022373665|nr:MauE/DoxX family redox-associated membrane protein [Muriicola sp. Z0-33]MCW5515422.1 DoxX family membrane protein [Muriicola sp. Z0-33]
MKIFWSIIRLIFAAFMIYAGVQHLLKPDFYEPFVPSFLPFTTAIIYASGILEILLGVLLLIPKYAKLGAMGLLLLMLIFLPIHIWDVFADSPAIGSQKAALIRLPVQFLFIGIAWKLKATLSR